ncbi:hypothetical protein C7B76_08480 [filamentous cyanobacterium CCP2]|nr:hypothetical protein C7B76_08480 [filamentous cyanobacterium CCP2]
MSISRADNTLGGAHDLQTISDTKTVKGFVGKADRLDFYKFTLQRSSHFTASLSKLKADANLTLLDQSGAVLTRSMRKGKAAESVSAELEPGAYYLRVNRRKGDTRYRLSIGATDSTSSPVPMPPAPIIDPGDTLTAARTLGLLTGNQTHQESIGGSDQVDLYKFSLNQISEFSTSLGGVTVGTDLNLIWDKNNNGFVDGDERIATGYASSFGNTPAVMTLAQGTYFVEVRTLSDRVSSYELSLSATAKPSNILVDPGNTLKTAHTVGSVSRSYTAKEIVGATDNTDYYQFTLNTVSDFRASVSRLSDSVNIALIWDKNNNGFIDGDERIAHGNGSIYGNIPITETLPKGTYFMEVKSSSQFNNTLYDLTLTTTPKPSNIAIDPGTTLNKTHNLGTLNTSLVAHDLVGKMDTLDFYKFTTLKSGTFNATLSGISDAVYVSLIRDLNGNGVIDGDERLAYGSASTTWNAPLTRSIAPGTYFVEVRSYAAFDNTAYTLALSI